MKILPVVSICVILVFIVSKIFAPLLGYQKSDRPDLADDKTFLGRGWATTIEEQDKITEQILFNMAFNIDSWSHFSDYTAADPSA